jgi:1-acyl-sn-glycerol-3-phosphate acyltransferase
LTASVRLQVRQWRERFDAYAQNCVTSGFIPDTFWPAQRLVRFLANLTAFIQLGRLSITGAENLRLGGRFIFCANHSSMFDAVVLFAIMRRDGLRYMTAFEEMTGLKGLKAVVMGALGCFPVDRTKGKTVIEPSINILVKGGSLFIFPEARISATGECLPFKNGPALIGLAAMARLGGEKVAIVPINISYHKRDVATATDLFLTCGLKWRGGVTVTVGQPIYLNELATNHPGEVMAMAHAFVCRAQSRDRDCPCRS